MVSNNINNRVKNINNLRVIHNNQAIYNHRAKYQGFTMVELLVALVVIAILTGVIFGIYSKNHDTADAQKTNADLITIVQGTKSAFAHDAAGYSNISSIGVLVSLGIIPGDLNITGTDENATVKNQFGGQVTTTVDSEGGWFQIAYPNVPSKVCIKILTTLNADSFSQIKAGDTVIYDNGATGGTATAYLDTLAIRDACGSGTVVMTFSAQ